MDRNDHSRHTVRNLQNLPTECKMFMHTFYCHYVLTSSLVMHTKVTTIFNQFPHRFLCIQCLISCYSYVILRHTLQNFVTMELPLHNLSKNKAICTAYVLYCAGERLHLDCPCDTNIIPIDRLCMKYAGTVESHYFGHRYTL